VGIFFDKRPKDKPLTESELRDSNNKLQDSHFSKRSNSYNKSKSRYAYILPNELSSEDNSKNEIQIHNNYKNEKFRENSLDFFENSQSHETPNKVARKLNINRESQESEIDHINMEEKLDSIEKKGTAQFNNLKKCNDDIADLFDKPIMNEEKGRNYIQIQENTSVKNSKVRSRSQKAKTYESNVSDLSNSLERDVETLRVDPNKYRGYSNNTRLENK